MFQLKSFVFEVQSSKKTLLFSFLSVFFFNSFLRICNNKLSGVAFPKSKKFTPSYLASDIRNSLLFFTLISLFLFLVLKISLAFVSQFILFALHLLPCADLPTCLSPNCQITCLFLATRLWLSFYQNGFVCGSI